ncbi:ATP-binding cassette sub-family G member 1-like isoform X2 [Haemaphysalis longicornis]
MGPSGAGKTTLLHILSGHFDKGYEGEVQVNGYVRDSKLFNMQSCYVMQDDCLLQYLTVREALIMSAELRLPTLEQQELIKLVADTISGWGLGDCADTLTHRLSGGEKRRLAISQELISRAPVMFLDEPTSGLDSCSALRCGRVLRSLADSGHTVICSIHNPSATLFSHFDIVYMLSSGMCIYNGSVEQLLPFLASQNLHCPIFNSPADFITEIASGEYGDMATKLSALFTPDECVNIARKKAIDSSQATAYGGRLMGKEERKQMKRFYGATIRPHQQLKVLLKRCFYSIARNKTASLLRIAVSLFFAVLLTTMYYGSGNHAAQARDIVSMYLLAIIMIVFQSVGPNVLTFPMDVSVLLREQRNCWYSPSVYYVSRIITELPLTIGAPTIMMTIVYWATSQPMELYRISLVLLFSIAVSSVSQSLAYVCSAALSVQMAVFVSLPAVAPWFILSGYFVQQRYVSAAIKWFTYTSHVYYGHRALMFVVFGGGRPQLECDERDISVACHPIDGEEVLDMLEARDINLSEYLSILLALDVSFKLFAFCLLKWRLWRKC